MKKMIWIIGSPRSGTSFLTDYVGQYTDKKYNEPWNSHPLETPLLWQFPEQAETIVFKYCENWRNLHALMNRWSESVYVHVWRDPDNVVYSMAYPKENSKPPRDLYKGLEGEEKLRVCMQRWFSNCMHCLSLINILPRKYCEIQYENMKPGLQTLGKMTGLEFNLDNLNYQNRNLEIELNWELNPTACQLRNLVKNYNGHGLLAEFINKKRPKFLQRVVL